VVIMYIQYCFKQSQSHSYVTTDGQSANLSWHAARIRGLRPDFSFCPKVAGLLMWSALSDERVGLSSQIRDLPLRRLLRLWTTVEVFEPASKNGTRAVTGRKNFMFSNRRSLLIVEIGRECVLDLIGSMYSADPQKLALTSPTCGGRSHGIVRLPTKATEFYVYSSSWFS
jgi:hypothetical protein